MEFSTAIPAGGFVDEEDDGCSRGDCFLALGSDLGCLVLPFFGFGVFDSGLYPCGTVIELADDLLSGARRTS